MAQSGGYPPPILESYSVEAPPPADVESFAVGETAAQEWVITLHGQNFIERAMMMVIQIGDTFVHKYSISPDGRTITCYLEELPEEGAEISVGYRPGTTTTLPQRFSRSQIQGRPPEAPAPGGESEE